MCNISFRFFFFFRLFCVLVVLVVLFWVVLVFSWCFVIDLSITRFWFCSFVYSWV